jgi:DNA polymerase-1
MNTPIQGTAADMIKLAMINIARELHRTGLQTRMLLQVHDELLFEVPEAEVEQARTLVLNEMRNALTLGDVPVEVEAGTGTNWLEAH